MTKKILKALGTLLALLSLGTLFFPWIYAYCEGRLVSADLTATGLELTQFSAWAVVVVVLPVLLLAVVYSRLNSKEKTVFILSAFLFGSISIFRAVGASLDSLQEVSTESLRPQICLILYPLFMFFSLTSFYLYYNADIKAMLKTMGIEECGDKAPISRELYVCSRPYEFAKFKDGEGSTYFSGCISFVTEDGYFAALGHGEDTAYLKNGCIEFFDGDNTAGFAMSTRESGVYGSFYEDYAFPKDTKMKLKPFSSIADGRAELWLPSEAGFIKKSVTIDPISAECIECRLSDGEKLGDDIRGAIVVQNGGVVAVVSACDEEKGIFSCVSALRVAMPLICMEYEQKQLEAEVC